MSFSVLKLWDLNFHRLFLFAWGIIITSTTSVLDSLIWFAKKLVSYKTINSNLNGTWMQKFHSSLIFLSILVSFHRHWWFTGQQGKRQIYSRDRFFSNIFTCSRSFRYLFEALNLRWILPFLIAMDVITTLYLKIFFYFWKL